MVRRRALAAAGLAVGVAAPAGFIAWPQDPPRETPAPAVDSWAGIELPDLRGGLRPVSGGAPSTLVNLWARWCAPCRRELPGLQRLAARLRADRCATLTVALDDDAFALREYVRDIGFELPVLRADLDALPARLRPSSLPQTLVLGRDGRVQHRIIGARDWDRDAAVQELFAHALKSG
jgi:thiol-disulfide isomerase/thioredoxin